MTDAVDLTILAGWVLLEPPLDPARNRVADFAGADTLAAVVFGVSGLLCLIISICHESVCTSVERRTSDRRPVSAVTRFLWVLGCPCCCLSWYWARFTHAVALECGESVPNLKMYLFIGPMSVAPIIWLAIFGPTYTYDFLVEGQLGPAAGCVGVWLLCLAGLRGTFYGTVGAFSRSLRQPLRWLLLDPVGMCSVPVVAALAIALVPLLSGLPKILPLPLAAN